jgi:low temperature requirement protein LtrA
MTSVEAHHRRRFRGRDPSEEHRAATPLELLYDLTLVVSFGVAADELAHYVADDHVLAGIAGFAFAAFAVSWAWINYSWFASAYDTDDWVFRLATMVQMVGVIVVALGLPQTRATTPRDARRPAPTSRRSGSPRWAGSRSRSPTSPS